LVNFLFAIRCVRSSLGVIYPAVHWVSVALPPEANLPDREPPSSAKVQNAWIFTSAPLYAEKAYSGRLGYHTFSITPCLEIKIQSFVMQLETMKGCYPHA